MNAGQKKPPVPLIILMALAMAFLASCGTTAAEGETTGGDYTNIVINEIQSKATDGYITCDFVELYNKSDSAYTFKSGEWYLTDSGGAPDHVLYIPGGTTISAKGFLVLLPDVTNESDLTLAGAPSNSIFCGEADEGSLTCAGFGLGAADSVSLYYTGSGNSVIADSSAWTSHVTNRVRYPDGGDWDTTNDGHTPTPGAANL